jgi:phosphatidylglycerol:prolipoprotein diacylglycerol transferase
MWPTLFEVQTATGPIGAHTYGLMILLAFCGAFLLVHFRAQRIGIHPDRLLPLYVAAAVGGLAGGRLLFAFAVDWERTIANPLSLFQPAGFAVYGGVIGGTIAVGAVARFMGIRPWKLADIAGPAVLLGMGIGRLGCLASGCCHGAVVEHFHPAGGLFPESFSGGQVWFSGEFPFVATEFASGNGGVSRLVDVPLYPTQLWAAVMLLGLAAGLSWAWEHKRFDGQIAALSLMLEPLYRISVEAFRADHRGYFASWPVPDSVGAWLPAGMTQAGEQLGDGVMMGITTSQAIGLGSLLFGLGIYAFRRSAGVAEEAPVRADDEDLPDLSDALS